MKKHIFNLGVEAYFGICQDLTIAKRQDLSAMNEGEEKIQYCRFLTATTVRHCVYIILHIFLNLIMI